MRRCVWKWSWDNPYKGDDFPMFVAKRDEVSQKIVF